MVDTIELDDLTNSQRRCVWSVGKFGSWDNQAQKHRGQCIDLGLMVWDDGAKLTPEGKEAYNELVRLMKTNGTYLR